MSRFLENKYMKKKTERWEIAIKLDEPNSNPELVGVLHRINGFDKDVNPSLLFLTT